MHKQKNKNSKTKIQCKEFETRVVPVINKLVKLLLLTIKRGTIKIIKSSQSYIFPDGTVVVDFVFCFSYSFSPAIVASIQHLFECSVCLLCISRSTTNYPKKFVTLFFFVIGFGIFCLRMQIHLA